jgi:PAS domain S-box-containing protein
VVIIAFYQRRKAIVQLKNSELKYRSLFQSSNEAILLIKPDMHIVNMNKAACRLFHYHFIKGSNVKLKDLYQTMEPEIDWRSTNTVDDNQIREGKVKCLDGSFFIGEINYTYYTDERENQYVVLMIRDITERKKMKARLEMEQMRHQRELTKQIIIAQENEREAIGYELHDNVNQILTTAKLYLETSILNKNEESFSLVEKSLGFIQSCIIEIRDLSHALSSPTLGTKSLVDSICSLLDHISTCTGLDIKFCHHDYTRELAKEHSLAIYRIVQEQLNNIVKHSSASFVSVVLKEDETGTILEIKDDGIGFDPAKKHKGIGLNNISSRVKAFNGHMSIHSSPGNGCRLSIRVPFNEELEYTED